LLASLALAPLCHTLSSASSFLPFHLPPPPRFTLFPYTTLFRSRHELNVFVAFRLGCHILAARLLDFELQRLGVVQPAAGCVGLRPEEHTSELQSPYDLVCRLLLEKKKKK